MPSSSSEIGGLTLPVAAGAVNSALADPVVDALLDFLGWMLNTELAAKLAQQVDAPRMPTPCPTDRRFGWNPMEPQGDVVKLPIPGLWIWQHGPSALVEHSMVLRSRTRRLRVLYLWDETPRKTGLERRAGLASAVDATFHKASVWQRHPSYAYGTNPAGMPIYQAIAEPGKLAWEYLGGEAVRFGIDGGQPVEADARSRTSGRDYPGVVGLIHVEEIIDSYGELEIPGDVGADVDVTIYGSDGETLETVELLDGVLDAPDGTEDGR